MLTINGLRYTEIEILSLAKARFETATIATWEASFWAFVQDWLAPTPFVTVKTSGSTGTPKLIQLTKKQMAASAFATGRFFNLKPQDRALLCLSCDYIAGKMMVVRAFELGLNLLLTEPSGLPTWHADTDPIQFAAFVPLQIANLLEQNSPLLQQLETVIIGGGAVSKNLQHKLETLHLQCFATYGMTETITHIAVQRLNGEPVSSYFRALDGVTFAQDNDRRLIIHAPHLAEKPVLTNDLVELKSQTTFQWVGRFDNIINTGGVKVSPERIESRLAAWISEDFFIAALPDEKLGQRLILVIEAEKDSYLLDNQAFSDLSKFEKPKEVFFLKEFIRTETGKIQRQKTIERLKNPPPIGQI